MSKTQNSFFDEILTKLKHEVYLFYGKDLVSLAVFGSVARGTATPESDIDILIISENLPNGRMKRVRQFLDMETKILTGLKDSSRILLSPIFKTPQEASKGSPLFWDMTEDLIILFDRKDFLKQLIDKIRRQLNANKARKIFRGNAWYWILKGDVTPGEIFEI